MANIITAEEVQEGDLIRVTRTEQYEDRRSTHTYEGVAVHKDSTFNGKTVWRTEKRNNFWVHEHGAVIELLDRPKPKIELPTGEGAVIEYTRKFRCENQRRVASFDRYRNTWRVVGTNRFSDSLEPTSIDSTRANMGKPVSHEWLTDLLNDDSKTSDFNVLFEGVAK